MTAKKKLIKHQNSVMECEMQRHTGGNRYVKNDIYGRKTEGCSARCSRRRRAPGHAGDDIARDRLRQKEGKVARRVANFLALFVGELFVRACAREGLALFLTSFRPASRKTDTITVRTLQMPLEMIEKMLRLNRRRRAALLLVRARRCR